jgi:outer membrane protein OmpA-like peptidoglycan-associated protein
MSPMRRGLLGVVVSACLSAGCGASGISNYVVADMERVRTSPGVADAAKLAPQEFALAENQRAAARKASHDGDEVSASLYAAQAVASYTDALVLARLARATVEKDRASADLVRDEARANKLAAERADAEHEADELEKNLTIAREMLTPATSGHADPAREAARLVAARALSAQARLLCGAARLVSPSLEGLDTLDKDIDALDRELSAGGKAAPIDVAARTRAACLGLLTLARRTSSSTAPADPDALLSDLSASGQFEPSRDERGVVVVLRGAFKGTTLTPAAGTALAELGRVSASHPAFAVQVVLHDASAPSPQDAAADTQRAQAAALALEAAGASAARVKAETAGARAPLVDPQDARHHDRNARLEVVFVSPSG